MTPHRTDATPHAESAIAPLTHPRRRTSVVAALALVGAFGVQVASPAGAAPLSPGRPVPALSVTYSYVDSNGDGAVDKIELVDPATISGSPAAPSGGASRPVAGVTSGRTASAATIAKLTKQLAVAKKNAAAARTAYVKAQRAAATLDRNAKKATTSARTARQRAAARQLTRRAATAAKVARTARVKSNAAAALVTNLTNALNKLTKPVKPVKPVTKPAPKPVNPAPKPVNPAPTPAPTPAPVPSSPPNRTISLSGTTCESMIAGPRPIAVTSEWKLSCVNSFPGVVVEPGYQVLGLTRYDSSRGIADVMVLRNQGLEQMRATLVHELAHAYSITTMRESQRAFFVNRLRAAGKTTATSFFSQSVSYNAMPAEIWARTQATCVGYPAPNSPFTEVTCADVNAALAA